MRLPRPRLDWSFKEMSLDFTTGNILTLIVLGILLLVGLGLGVVIVTGLFNARSLLRKEFGAYFLSPIAYVVLVLFLLVTGHLFYLTLEQLTASGPKGVEFPMQFMLGDERFWLVFLFIPPLLTMRLFAEERSTGTLEMLMTAPVRDWQVVLAKLLACYAFYVLLWLPTLVYLPVLLNLRPPVFHAVWTPYTYTLIGGVAALLFGFLLLLLPAGTSIRALIFGILLGAVCVGAGIAGYMKIEEDDPLRIV